MKTQTQIALLEELLGLKQQDALFLDERPTMQSVSSYIDEQRFEREQQQLFQTLPSMLAHSSALAGAGSFLRLNINGQPLLLIRGDDGQARVFLNVCRHRGTRLVDDTSGCRQRFSCPYHAWTWNSRGDFVGAPHFESGFPGVDPSTLGLKALACQESHGFIWLMPEESQENTDDFLYGLGEDFDWIGLGDLEVKHVEEQQRRANWKLLVEGGLEAYHFKVAHRHSIAPLFNDNLSSYQCFGPHFRSVLPRSSITELQDQPRDSWDIRKHSNLLYNIFPAQSLLVQADHVVWVRNEPLSVDHTRLTLATLVPRESDRCDSYWEKNHNFTVKTLNEDFDLAESIQSGMNSGANDALHFGRFEGALGRFNQTIENRMSAGADLANKPQ